MKTEEFLDSLHCMRDNIDRVISEIEYNYLTGNLEIEDISNVVMSRNEDNEFIKYLD